MSHGLPALPHTRVAGARRRDLGVLVLREDRPRAGDAMSRILYCRHCAVGYGSVAGDMPSVCPHCEQQASWTTMAPEQPARRTVLALSEADRRLLRRLRIAED